MAESRRDNFVSAAWAFAASTNRDGGASVNATTYEVPEVGKSKGWMVGGHPDATGKRIPEDMRSKPPLQPHEAAAHIAKVAILTGGSPDAYAGSWVADRDGEPRVALDASTRVPGREAARALGNHRNEDAIFGLENGTERLLKAGQRKKARKAAGQA